MPRKKYIYALYKGDKFIDLGTLEELSQTQKVQKHTLMFYQSPAYKRRTNEKERKVLIKIEEDN